MMLSCKKIQKYMPNSNGNVYNVYANYRPILLFSCIVMLLLSNESNSCKCYK